MNGSGGCNRISGTFTRTGVALKMACTDPPTRRGANEAQFISALQSTTSYRLAGPTRLALLDASGRTVALLNSGGR
ncbi:META domain-containing protein [Variovorax atrisoli]|uniref:META domain-containing protein n=1 Tax=Variovorax atrisoli TaxID=3394203 RepID=UPI003AAF529A